MKVYVLKSSKLGSKLIRWSLNEHASHLAISFQLSDKVVFFHSYGLGMRKERSEVFLKKYEVVAHLSLETTNVQEYQMYNEFLEESYGVWYDYPALAYFGWRALLKKAFKIPYPAKNMWEDRGAALCPEILYLLSRVYYRYTWKRILPPGLDLAMVSPIGAFNYISQAKTKLKI